MTTGRSSETQIANAVCDELEILWPGTGFDVGAAFGSSGLVIAASWIDGPVRHQVAEVLRRRSWRTHTTRIPSVLAMAWCLAQTGASRQALQLHSSTSFDPQISASAGPLVGAAHPARRSSESLAWSRSRQIADLAVASTRWSTPLGRQISWSTVATVAALTSNDSPGTVESATVLARECPQDGRSTLETLEYALAAARRL